MIDLRTAKDLACCIWCIFGADAHFAPVLALLTCRIWCIFEADAHFAPIRIFCLSAPGAPALTPGPHTARAAAAERRDRLADPVSVKEREREYTFPLQDQTGIGTISMCALIWFQFCRSFQPAIGTISALRFIWFQFCRSFQPAIGTISALRFIWFQFTTFPDIKIGTIRMSRAVWFQSLHYCI